MKVKPHIHGDWKVTEEIKIEVTNKDSNGQREYIPSGERILFVGSLNDCEMFVRNKSK